MDRDVMQSHSKTKTTLIDAVTHYAERANLPAVFVEEFMREYAPRLAHLAVMAKTRAYAPIIGLSGCQGSGKSTLAQLFEQLLQDCFGLHCAALSLDDVYLTRQQRETLAQDVHPLFSTRGVPGTHDIALLTTVLDDLQHRSGTIRLPRFNKAEDERTILARWPQFSAPADIIILEGWCLGVSPQSPDALMEPINRLESEQDPEGVWRQAINNALAGPYQALCKRLDALLFLQAPSFDCVFNWRWQQELALIETNGSAAGQGIMNHDQVSDFILHFERLTRHALASLPKIADGIWELDEERHVKNTILRGVLL